MFKSRARCGLPVDFKKNEQTCGYRMVKSDWDM